MTKVQNLKTNLITAGLIIICALSQSTAALATDANKLEGVESRNILHWPWGVGGGSEDAPVNYQASKNNDFFSSVKVKTRSEDWENINLGDGTRGYTRIPLIKF